MSILSIGETIKTIRTAKKITSKSLYNDILSRPSIARFERGLSDTSATKLFIILERLNITLEEFEKIRNDVENKDFLYTVEYIEAFYRKDIVRLILNGYKINDFLCNNDIDRLSSLLWLSGCINWNFVRNTIKILETNNEEILKKHLDAYKERGEKLLSLIPKT